MSRKKIDFNEVEKLANVMIDLPGVPESINKVVGAIVSTSVVYDVDPNICKDIMMSVIEGVIEQAENSDKIKRMREVNGHLDKLLKEMLQVNNDDLDLFKKMFGDDVNN